MSEFAQQRLEQLLPVFEELQRVQLFSNEEVKRIIKKCQMFEHKLEKRKKKKKDFVKYVQYLVYFLALIRERRHAVKYFYKKKEIDYAIGAKIESLFRAACHRFQGDINLWLSRIEFAKTQQLHVSVSRIFMRLLQVHTDKPYLWIAAAKWEFEENGSAESARALLQRGLRFNSECKKLYMESFRLELLYVEKLRRRNEVLQLTAEKPIGENDETDSNGSVETAAPSGESDPILRGQLARIVFDDAAQTFEGDVEFCVDMAKIAGQYSFAQDLVAYIYVAIDTRYQNKEERYAALAERQYTENPFDIEPCQKIFEEALERFHSAKIWRLYIQFYLKRLEDFSCPNRHSVLNHCLQTFERASAAKVKPLDEGLYTKWISLCDGLPEQGKVAEMGVKGYPKSASLLECLLKWKMASGVLEKDVMKFFNHAVRVLPEKETLSVWRLALSWAVQVCPERVESLLKASQIMDSSVSSPLKIIHLQWLLATEGLDALRKSFRRLCDQKPNSLDFYLTYYEMELAQVRPHPESIRFCFEQAVFEHGASSPDLWLRYVKFELKGLQGDPARVSSIYERAIKGLEEEKVEGFMREYFLLTKEK